MADIFISYARTDRDRIETLAAALEAEGYSVWWDKRIQSGSEFSKDIEAQLDAASAVIVCWSKNANDSRWVKDEANAGAEAGKLMAVSLDAELPPMGFRQFHCADFSGWKGKPAEEVFQNFNSAVAARMSDHTPAPSIVPASSPKNHRGVHHSVFIVAIVAAAIVAVVAFGVNYRSDSPDREVTSLGMTQAPRIAVVPIEALGGDGTLSGMAQSLRGDITSGLSRFSMIDVAAAGDDSTAQYQLKANLRQSGTTLRLSAQLIDTTSGEQIWGEAFDRITQGRSMFEIQDDLTDHLVASVADPYGALMRDLQAPVARKDPETLTPYEAVVRNSLYVQRVSADEHLISRTALRRAANLEPNNSDVWAALSGVNIDEIKHDFNMEPGSADRALEQARRAIAIDPDNGYAHFALAEAHFFRRELGPFVAARERTLELNPRDTRNVAMLGVMSAYAGDWDLGINLTRRAMALNPNHPGWYRFTQLFNEYRQGNYEAALKISNAINMPEYFADPYTRAMILGQLGREDQAVSALNDFKTLWRGDMQAFKRVALENWMWAQPDLQTHIIEGLQKAGLEIDGGTEETALRPKNSIAVLPFEALSADRSDAFFGKGLAEELLNALAKIPELAVAARTSAFSFEGTGTDTASIAERLGVNYVLEGSVRRSGERLRISAQLVRASDGFQLWSETYERAETDIFAIEDEIVRNIARALEVRLGVGAGIGRASGEGVDPRAYEFYLRGLSSWGDRMKTDGARGEAIASFERATEIEPAFAGAWHSLASSLLASVGSPLARDRDAFAGRIERALNRALEIDPKNPYARANLAWWHLTHDLDLEEARSNLELIGSADTNSAQESGWARVLYATLSGDVDGAINAFDRLLTLDPLNYSGQRVRAEFLSLVGRYDQAFAFYDQCHEDQCLAEGFYAFVMTSAILEGDPARIAKWLPIYEEFEARVDDLPDTAVPPVARLVPAFVSIELDRPDRSARIEQARAIFERGIVSDTPGIWTPAFARVFPPETIIAALELAYERGDLFSTPFALAPFYGNHDYPETILRHPRYHALWEKPGMPEIAAARQSNGYTAGLPLAIDRDAQ